MAEALDSGLMKLGVTPGGGGDMGWLLKFPKPEKDMANRWERCETIAEKGHCVFIYHLSPSDHLSRARAHAGETIRSYRNGDLTSE